ncbi:MAG: hypothetical protein IJR35_01625 [Synergistaceae bacterium]|nr:hypothetical protein [Synergistaceae bacterium]MBR0204470.1 hypothetical protein [Synergistaceae bacterium]
MKKFVCVLLVFATLCSPVAAMTKAQEESCNLIIHGAAAAAAGSALIMAQAPGADNLALAAAIGGMTIGLANVFDLSFGDIAIESIGVSILGYFSTMIAARIASQWVFGWIPFLGNSVNTATMFGMVEWIGWTVAEALDKAKNATAHVAGKVYDGVITVAEFLDALSGNDDD